MKTDQEMVRWALEESSEPVIKKSLFKIYVCGWTTRATWTREAGVSR